MKSIVRNAALILLALFAGSAAAASIHPEVGAGVMQYSLRRDGTWYQLGMPHKLKTTGGAIKIGIAGPAYSGDVWNVDWHADYVRMANISSDCMCTTFDSDYSSKTQTVTHGGYIPTARYAGHGNAQGILLSLSASRQVGRWRIGAEGGLFPYRPHWDMTVYGWHTAENGPRITASVNTPLSPRIGEMAGIFAQRGHTRISYEFYHLPTRFDSKHSPAIWIGAQMVMLTYEF